MPEIVISEQFVSRLIISSRLITNDRLMNPIILKNVREFKFFVLLSRILVCFELMGSRPIEGYHLCSSEFLAIAENDIVHLITLNNTISEKIPI